MLGFTVSCRFTFCRNVLVTMNLTIIYIDFIWHLPNFTYLCIALPIFAGLYNAHEFKFPPFDEDHER